MRGTAGLNPFLPSIQERAGPQNGQSPSHKDAVALPIPQNVDDGEQGHAIAFHLKAHCQIVLLEVATAFRRRIEYECPPCLEC